MRHAEVSLHAFFGGAALAVADHHDLFAGKPRHSADHRGVVAEGAIAMDLGEIREDPLDQVRRVRALRMARLFNPRPGGRNRNGLFFRCMLLGHGFLSCSPFKNRAAIF